MGFSMFSTVTASAVRLSAFSYSQGYKSGLGRRAGPKTVRRQGLPHVQLEQWSEVQVPEHLSTVMVIKDVRLSGWNWE